MSEPTFIHLITRGLRDRLQLGEDRHDQAQITAAVAKGVEIRGQNLWLLVAAILIASIGLNVNSTAVIIGAMLISPLMGPIMGIGLAVAVLDWPLYKRSLKNFLVMVAISLTASTLYFLVSPLSLAGSELLARTRPAIWDVGIALVGGVAGMVGLSSRERGNVLPGVAIATALMPPLCTAGYGLATGNWAYLAGAGYLFFINALFISLGTLLTTRVLGFVHVAMPDARTLVKVRRSITLLVVITVVPSLYLASRMVSDSLRDQRIQAFLDQELDLPDTRVLTWELDSRAKPPRVELLLVGRPLGADTLSLLQARWRDHQLGGLTLVLRQEGAGRNPMPARADDRVEEVLLRQLRAERERWRSDSAGTAGILAELKAIHPGVETLALAPALRVADTVMDTVLLVEVQGGPAPDKSERARLEAWLATRTKHAKVLLRHLP